MRLFIFNTQVHRLKKSASSVAAKKVVGQALTTARHASVKSKLASLKVQLSEYVSGQSLEFVMSQLAMSQRVPRGRRWSSQQKAFSLSLLHSSPKTYKLLRKVFALPSPRILKKAMQAIQVYPGINTNILEALRIKTSKMSAQDKLVAIMIDEISIRECLSYDQSRDVIEGVTEGESRGEELANHALVFMVRGIVRKWKQPLAYYLSSGPMTGAEMKPLLLACIDSLQSIGLKVMLCVCDQGSNNRNLYETQLGVTVESPIFM